MAELLEAMKTVVTIIITHTPFGDFQALALPYASPTSEPWIMYGEDAQDLARELSECIRTQHPAPEQFRAIIVRDDSPFYLHERCNARDPDMYDISTWP